MNQLVNVDDLRPGTVVRLISGSPKMAVVEVATREDRSAIADVHVLWWSDRLGICQDKFPAELLVYPRGSTPDDAE